jgi:hypothetical protein
VIKSGYASVKTMVIKRRLVLLRSPLTSAGVFYVSRDLLSWRNLSKLSNRLNLLRLLEFRSFELSWVLDFATIEAGAHHG